MAINQHKHMAMGMGLGQDGDSLPAIGAGHIKHPDRKAKGDYLPDGKRAIGKPVKLRADQHPAQAAPDHGPMIY